MGEVVRDGFRDLFAGRSTRWRQRAGELPGRFSAANVRQYCQQYFSVERMVADYVALYQELVGEDSLLA